MFRGHRPVPTGNTLQTLSATRIVFARPWFEVQLEKEIMMLISIWEAAAAQAVWPPLTDAAPPVAISNGGNPEMIFSVVKTKRAARAARLD